MLKFETMYLRETNISLNGWLYSEYPKSITGGTSTTFTIDIVTLILEVKEMTFIGGNLFIVTPIAKTRMLGLL